ncbi:MAG: winged helix-turn-helix domain-containing protein [Acidobacteriaceae bacterium]|nr:winged helix-turn-helix domain-containing protein [Acidobacteriaceae bacterium]
MAMLVLSYTSMGVLYNHETALPKRGGNGCSKKIYKFGVFELRPETGELSKNGIRIKLQSRPCQVLEALLERPGELVTRQDLCARLWPTGTFVDFESGLNTATNRLRSALGDSAETPRYIETLPRLGYRFICPVIEIQGVDTDGTHAAEVVADYGFVHSESMVTPKEAAHGFPKDPIPTGKGARVSSRVLLIAFGAIAAEVILVAFYVMPKATPRRPEPQFKQLTFQSGSIGTARFTPDSTSVLYSAKWEDRDSSIYRVRLSDLASQALNVPSAMLAAVSPRGEMAVTAAEPAESNHMFRVLRVSLTGQTIGVLGDEIRSMDWVPGRSEVALVRQNGTQSIVEFPSGRPIYSSQGWIDSLRVAPCGDLLAFIEHPVRDDTAGYVRILTRAGATRALTGNWNSAEGLAWSRRGDEIWFTASKNGARTILYAVSDRGALRQISDTPSSIRLLDISRSGTVLLSADDERTIMRGGFGQSGTENDLSQLDGSHVDDISADGRFVLFTEAGEGGGSHYGTFLYDRDARSALRVASGRALAISPDGNWILTIDPQDRSQLALMSVKTGIQKNVPRTGLVFQWARFLPGGDELLVAGAYPGKPLQLFKEKMTGGKPLAIEKVPYLDYVVLSADGKRLAGLDSSFSLEVVDMNGRHYSIASRGSFPVGWTDSGELLYLLSGNSGYRIMKKNLDTGEEQTWKTIPVSKTPGFAGLANIVVSRRMNAYVYSSHVDESRLYAVTGWS